MVAMSTGVRMSDAMLCPEDNFPARDAGLTDNLARPTMLRSLVRGGLADRALRDREGPVGDRHARVHRDLQQDLADLLRREAVAQRGLDVHGQLGLVLHGGQ